MKGYLCLRMEVLFARDLNNGSNLNVSRDIQAVCHKLRFITTAASPLSSSETARKSIPHKWNKAILT